MTETSWYHHEFEPIRVDGDRRIVAPEEEWAALTDLHQRVNNLRETCAANGWPYGRRPRILVGELFEDWKGPIITRDGHEVRHGSDPELQATMADIRARFFRLADAPNVDFILETRFPERFEESLPTIGWPLAGVPGTLGRRLHYENIWLAVAIGTQLDADKLIIALLAAPAAKRVVIARPEEAIDLITAGAFNVWRHGHNCTDWVIVGGESGPRARSCNLEWIRSIIRQCESAGVKCFVEQLGSRPVSRGQFLHTGSGADWDSGAGEDDCAIRKMKDKKGGDPDEWPEDLRVREIP